MGLAVVVLATLVAILFGWEHALAWESLGRLFIVGTLSFLAWQGRRWATIALGVVVVTACVGLIVGAAQAGLRSRWGILFGLDALLFAAGFLWFLRASRGAPGTGRARG